MTIINIYNIIADEISTNCRVILHTRKSLIIPHYRAFAIYNETTISCRILRYFISDTYVFIIYNDYKRSEQWFLDSILYLTSPMIYCHRGFLFLRIEQLKSYYPNQLIQWTRTTLIPNTILHIIYYNLAIHFFRYKVQGFEPCK